MWLELRDLLGPHERFQREGVLIFVDLHFFFFLIGIVYLPWCPERRKWGGGPPAETRMGEILYFCHLGWEGSPRGGFRDPDLVLWFFIRSLTLFRSDCREDLDKWVGGEGAKLSSQNGSCPSSEADGPGGGEKGRGGGGGLVSRSRRLLRSPSSLALTDGPAAPWGGLRTLVGGGGAFPLPRWKGP